MPRSGSGTFSWPAGSYAVPNTPISSVKQNAILDDSASEFNSPRPVSAGGTGATSPASAFEALSPMTARGDLLTRDATVSKRLPIGAAGTILGSDGTDVLWKAATAGATEDAAGTLEIATEAENAARASAVLAVTPKYNPLPPGHLFGCTLSNGVDAVNDIEIYPGMARDSTDAVNIILPALLSKRLDAAWAVGSGQGGLDTGTAANTTYHVWLIKRADTGVVDALLSASLTPTMPANYTHKRRVGSIIRSAGSILAFAQNGDEFLLDTPVADSDTNPGVSSVVKVCTVPLGIPVNAMVTVMARNNNASTQYLLISSFTQTNAVPSINLYDIAFGQDQGANGSIWRALRTSTAGAIRYRLDASSASTVITVLTQGWVDMRGRLL